ncbi:RabGAP/TBC [Cystobasidium minutum MCA 4210]|uniref:RabGAP/TBC n=1 Tax=Cystobasidium minutum MCA 4210 TaxID=1397322 RepID=UPI0034CD6433|eukprot:jgi/Rhomi1/151920/estExt_Genewise1.C_3_t30288
MGGGPATSSPSSSTAARQQQQQRDVEQQEREYDDIITIQSSESDPDTVQVHLKSTAAMSSSGSSPGPGADDKASSSNPKCTLKYCKSACYIHPTSYSRDNVQGWIAISKRGKRDFLLSWLPDELVRSGQDKDKFVKVEIGDDGELDASEEVSLSDSLTFEALSTSFSNTHAWSIPLSAIYSISVTPPTLANWYGNIQIHLCESFLQTCSDENGQTRNIPTLPLYFHDDESPSTMLMMDRRSQAMKDQATSKNINTSNGNTFNSSLRLPSSWGGEDLILALKKYANVVKSTASPNSYLVNPSQADLEAHSVPLYEDELLSTSGAAAVLKHRNRANTGNNNSGPSSRTSILHQSLSPQAGTSNSEALPTLDNLTFNVLSSFSRLTNRAKASAQNIAHPILSHPLSKPILKHLPPPVQSLANANSPEYSKWAERAGVAGYDAARVYLARWARTVAEEGERNRKSEIRFTSNGLASLDDDDGAAGVLGADELGGPFQILATTYRIPRPRSTRVQGCQPIIESEWDAWFDHESGKLMLSGQEAKKRIFQRGLVEGARRKAWPFLLDVYPWDSTSAEREEIYKRNKEEYEHLKGQWFGRKEVTSTDQFVEEHHRIRIDCLRTDRTQPMFSSDASALPISGGDSRSLMELHNAQMAASMIDTTTRGGIDSGGHPPGNYHTHKLMEILLTYNVKETELGYVQGMSDLASPLYIVLEGDESLVFWCFVNLMEQRMKPNFYRDQSGMKAQLSVLQELIALMDPQLYSHLEKTDSLNLFFCFRWILIAFKREFKLEDCLSIWEAIWSSPATSSFHLFIALSILESHRGVIMRYLQEFDEVLKYINELAGTMDPYPIINQAEVLYLAFRNLVEATDRRKAERASVNAASSGGTTEAAGDSGLRKRNAATNKASTPPLTSKEKEKDPLVKIVNDEAEAEARVPDITLSKELRALAF